MNNNFFIDERLKKYQNMRRKVFWNRYKGLQDEEKV
jgi:hypothetical protein